MKYQSKLVDTGQMEDLFGSAPQGFITYGQDGRVMVLIVSGDRPHPADVVKMTDQQRADLFRTMIAYSGTYTRYGDKITHHLDISWNEAWTGTDQLRNVKIDGDRLTLSTNAQPRSQDGKMAVNTLIWEKLK